MNPACSIQVWMFCSGKNVLRKKCQMSQQASIGDEKGIEKMRRRLLPKAFCLWLFCYLVFSILFTCCEFDNWYPWVVCSLLILHFFETLARLCCGQTFCFEDVLYSCCDSMLHMYGLLCLDMGCASVCVIPEHLHFAWSVNSSTALKTFLCAPRKFLVSLSTLVPVNNPFVWLTKI